MASPWQSEGTPRQFVEQPGPTVDTPEDGGITGMTTPQTEILTPLGCLGQGLIGTPKASASYVAGLTEGETTFDVPDETRTANGESAVVDGEVKPISKNQLKKQKRLQRFAGTREQWKARKREKQKATKARKQEEKKKKAEEAGVDVPEPPEKKREKPVVHDIGLIMDCGFDDLMTEKEIISMSAQLTRCYSANRNSRNQFKIQVTSLNKRLLQRYETALANQHLRWININFSQDPYKVTEKDTTEVGDLIYLTADSDNTIQTLEPGKKYIIGGIVDRNRYKNLCFNKANEQKIKTARLPIGDYIKMASRQVLTTNQVVEIMLNWLETRDWESAFMKVIPQRKMPKLVRDESKGEGEEGEEEETRNIKCEQELGTVDSDLAMKEPQDQSTKLEDHVDDFKSISSLN